MMAPYLLSGSIAYDTIMYHAGEFHERILPESLKRMNVSFGIDNHQTEFGGTAGNIAYNAALLGQNPMLIASVGNDFDDYEKHFEKINVNMNYLTRYTNEPTAHVWIPTDSGNSQFYFFSAGAMKNIPNLPELTPELWLLSPENPSTTALLAKTAIEQKKKYFFDPGQCLPAYLEGAADSVMNLKDLVLNASGLFLNEYESQLLVSKTGITLEKFVYQSNKFIIKTRGGNGLDVITHNSVVTIPVAHPQKITDPTGCGDALRAGFMTAYTEGHNLIYCAKLGAVMGSFAVETNGGQNHQPTAFEIKERFNMSYSMTR